MSKVGDNPIIFSNFAHNLLECAKMLFRQRQINGRKW